MCHHFTCSTIFSLLDDVKNKDKIEQEFKKVVFINL